MKSVYVRGIILAVSLCVAGASTAQVTVPNLAGLARGTATTTLQGAGLVLGTTKYGSSANYPSGKVYRQSPVAGTSVASGTSVDVVVATNPSPAKSDPVWPWGTNPSNGAVRNFCDAQQALVDNTALASLLPPEVFAFFSPLDPAMGDVNGTSHVILHDPYPDGGREFQVGGNGKNDCQIELRLIGDILANTSFNLPAHNTYAGLTHATVLHALNTNYEQLEQDFGSYWSLMAAIFNGFPQILLGHMLIGDGGAVYSDFHDEGTPAVSTPNRIDIQGSGGYVQAVVFLMSSMGGITMPQIDLNDYVRMPEFFAMEGDADGDGSTNQCEYTYTNDAGAFPGLSAEQRAETYVQYALDPAQHPPAGAAGCNSVPCCFTQQPLSQTVREGDPVSFSIVVPGAGPFSYQWKKDNSPIPDATRPTYTIAAAQFSDAGEYVCSVTNEFGWGDSAVATLTVGTPPTITLQPQSQTVSPGTRVEFDVAATGTAPIHFQWQQDGTAIPDATGTSYVIEAATMSRAGIYACRAFNVAGSVYSDNASLIIRPSTITLTTRALPPDGGGVTPSGATYWAYGTTVPLVAQAHSGYRFSQWIGGVANALTASTSIYLTQDATVTALFEAAGQVLVPNLIGLSRSEATVMLQAQGLALGTVRYGSSATQLPGRVYRQNPAPGTPVNGGAAVGVVVALQASPPLKDLNPADHPGADGVWPWGTNPATAADVMSFCDAQQALMDNSTLMSILPTESPYSLLFAPDTGDVNGVSYGIKNAPWPNGELELHVGGNGKNDCRIELRLVGEALKQSFADIPAHDAYAGLTHARALLAANKIYEQLELDFGTYWPLMASAGNGVQQILIGHMMIGDGDATFSDYHDDGGVQKPNRVDYTGSGGFVKAAMFLLGDLVANPRINLSDYERMPEFFAMDGDADGDGASNACELAYANDPAVFPALTADQRVEQYVEYALDPAKSPPLEPSDYCAGTGPSTKAGLTTHVTPAGAGVVTPQGVTWWDKGTTVSLLAQAAQGYAFSSWVGNVADTLNAATSIYMDKDETVTARFEPLARYSLSVNIDPVGAGTVLADTPGPYSCGTVVTLTAQAHQGYTFLGWDGAVPDLGTPLRATVVFGNANVVATAHFVPTQVTLTALVTPEASGTVTPAGSTQWNVGANVELLAAAAYGYTFASWTGAVNDPASPHTSINLTRNEVVTANFMPLRTVTLLPSTGGHVEDDSFYPLDPGTFMIPDGTVLTIIGVPDANYVFAEWQDGTGAQLSTAITYTSTVTGDMTIRPVFRPLPYLTTSVLGGHGTLAPQAGYQAIGAVVELLAAPEPEYRVKAWTGTDDDSRRTCANTVTMSSDKTVSVEFEPIPTYGLAIDISPMGGGTVTVDRHGPYVTGTVVVLTAHASTGYVFASWGGDAVPALTDPLSATVVIGNTNATATASFSLAQVTLTTLVSPPESGTVAPAGETQWNIGQTVDLLAQAAQGYEFDHWTGSVASPFDASTSITMAQAETVTATFRLVQIWTVTLLDSEGGGVSNSVGDPIAPGTYAYRDGTALTFAAVPDANHTFVEWQDEAGNRLSTVATYTFAVSADMTIKPIFHYSEVLIDSITPGEAWLFGGVVATIRGQHFKETCTLAFNDTPLIEGQDWRFIDSTTITFVVPPLAEQLVQTEFAVKPDVAPDAQPSTMVSVVVSNGANPGDTANGTFVYKRYEAGADGVVTTAFQATYEEWPVTKYIPFALDGVANNVGIFGSTTNGGDFVLPLPVVPAGGSYYGLIRAAKRPKDGSDFLASPLLTDTIDPVAGANSLPVDNAWDFSVHFYETMPNPSVLEACLNQTAAATGLFDEVDVWSYNRGAAAASITFPVDDTALTAESMGKGVTVWATETTFDYGAEPASELAGPALDLPYQSSIVRTEYVTSGTAVKQVTVRAYDLSALSLRTGRTNIALDPAHVTPVDNSHLEASLAGGSVLHIHSDTGGLAWARVGFHLSATKASETVATEYAIVKQWNPDTSQEIDGGRNEFDIYVRIPAYPNSDALPVGTAPEAGVSIYALADLYPIGDDVSGSPLPTATPCVVMTDRVVYSKTVAPTGCVGPVFGTTTPPPAQGTGDGLVLGVVVVALLAISRPRKTLRAMHVRPSKARIGM